jgi:RHH-type proline utilization regulon transcriptional repressor/proline dehydrogenase/delta 1-pyrroline-5-carboxylate dehydrogenase
MQRYGQNTQRRVRIGIASHNLFHMTWALEVAKKRGVLDQVDIEMLEGMANAEALAVTRAGQPVLLYAPVTRKDDFAAVAYLVRRLDENTADENYLKAAFDIAKKSQEVCRSRISFSCICKGTSFNHHRIAAPYEASRGRNGAHFENERNADPTDPEFIRKVSAALEKVRPLRIKRFHW